MVESPLTAIDDGIATISRLTLTGWYSVNSLDFYSGSTWFEVSCSFLSSVIRKSGYSYMFGFQMLLSYPQFTTHDSLLIYL